jgi:hypothetical protein
LGLKKGTPTKLVSGKDDGEVKEMWDTIAGGDSEVLLFFLSELSFFFLRFFFL